MGCIMTMFLCSDMKDGVVGKHAEGGRGQVITEVETKHRRSLS